MIISNFSYTYLTCPSLCFYESGRTNQWDQSISIFFWVFPNLLSFSIIFSFGRDHVVVFVALPQALSPQILHANWISFGIMVTCLACMLHKMVSSNKKMRYASATSCNAVIAAGDILNSCPPHCRSCTNSLERQSNGALLIRSSVDHWYLLISRSSTVPGLYLLGFGPSVFHSFPPLCLASALATTSLLASFLDRVGTPDALFLAVCFVLAILMLCVSMTE